MIKFGIAGMGIRGKLFASTLKQNNWACVAAACDIDEKTCKKAAAQFGINVYPDVYSMLWNEKIDAVIISTPDFLHKEAVLAAVGMKLDIMIEKPFSTDLAEYREMTDEIKKSGIKCMIAFENRWNPLYIEAKNRVSSKYFGDIVTINAALNDTIVVPRNMLSWADNSSPAWFLFQHLLDLAFWITGKVPKNAFASCVRKKLISIGNNTYDAVSIIFTYMDGSMGTFTTNWVQAESYPTVAEVKFDIIGTNNTLNIHTDRQMMTYACDDKFVYPRKLTVPLNGHLTAPPCYMLEYFIDCLRTDEIPMAGVDDGLINTLTISAIHESLKTGKVVEIDV